MKKIYTTLLCLFVTLQWVSAQDIVPIDSVILNTEHIAGRWIEKERFVNENDTIIPKLPYTYIFKDDLMFHRGVTTNDVLIFNVTGRYEVVGDLVTVIYRDYMNKRPGANKDRKMTFKILAWSEQQMTALVKEPYAKEYMVILTKQIF